jgi:hypothetical protein
VPEATRREIVMGRPRNLIGGRLGSGILTTLRQAQRVLVIGTVQIAGTVLKNEQYRAMQARYRDL